MKTLLLLAAPLCALAACNSQPTTEVVDTNPDPLANQLANSAPVALPPSIRADKTFRCTDGSVVGVTFFKGDTLASVRVPATGTPTRLTAPAAGEPYVAEGGWKLTGNDSSITVSGGGKSGLSCHT